jgi:hypothetical protein
MLGAEFWTPTRIFVLFIALQAAVNYDNGALPASLVTPSSESQRAMSTYLSLILFAHTNSVAAL